MFIRVREEYIEFEGRRLKRSYYFRSDYVSWYEPEGWPVDDEDAKRFEAEYQRLKPHTPNK